MELIILIFAAFITSSISAVLGMGGGIILLGVMAILIPDGYMVIALHGIIQLVSNTTRTYIFKNHLKKTILLQFLIGAIIGVFIHGYSAEICLKNETMETMIPSNIINNFEKAFKLIK